MEKGEKLTTPKKKVTPKKNKEEILVSETEVWDVLKFAAQAYNMYGGNPLLVNSRMQDVTLSPMIATSENVEQALQDPKGNEAQLIGYAEYMELTSMLYKRIVYYLSGMLSFDLTYTCKNITKDSEYKSPLYKSDLKIVQNFLDSFDVKKEFKLVTRQIVRNEVHFSIFREDGEKYTLQELPKDYCLITGRWDYGILFDFDMNWFLQSGVDVNMYPSIFKKMYNKAFVKVNDKPYNPATPVDERTGSWVKWVQTSPKDGFWAFKLNPELATKIPFLAPLFPDVVIQPIIRKLQTNSYIASASKILIGQVPMLDKSVKGASVKDAVAVTPDMLGKFLAVLKSGLSESVKVGAAPLEDMQGISFPLDAPFYQDYLKTTTSSSGVNSRLIYTLDKNNALESQLSINVDEFLMTYVYPYFSDFLEYHINKRTTKFKFQFTFEGTEFFTNRKERLENSLTLADKGIVLPQKISAAIGMMPHVFERQLAEARASGFVDKLTPILSSFNISKQDSVGGRPSKATSDLSDSGAETRDGGYNVEKGGDE